MNNEPSVPDSIWLSTIDAATGEPSVVLAMETPIAVMPSGLSKQTLERAQLERYRSDYLLRTGSLPFDAVKPGDDPSDFIVEAELGSEALDCAALALKARRASYPIFDRSFREGLRAAAESGEFDHLKNTLIRVWFFTESKLPPKGDGGNTVAALIAELRRYNLDRSALSESAQRAIQEGFPQQLPAAIRPIATPDGSAGCQVIPFPEGAQPIEFRDGPGIAFEFHMSSHVSQSELRGELNRVIVQHDHRPTTHLLITLGGPDRNGRRYPGEAALEHLLFQGGAPPCPPVKQLTKVTLHCWTSGRIERIR